MIEPDFVLTLKWFNVNEELLMVSCSHVAVLSCSHAPLRAGNAASVVVRAACFFNSQQTVLLDSSLANDFNGDRPRVQGFSRQCSDPDLRLIRIVPCVATVHANVAAANKNVKCGVKLPEALCSSCVTEPSVQHHKLPAIPPYLL